MTKDEELSSVAVDLLLGDAQTSIRCHNSRYRWYVKRQPCGGDSGSCKKRFDVLEVCRQGKSCAQHKSRIVPREMTLDQLLSCKTHRCCCAWIISMKSESHDSTCFKSLAKAFAIPPPFWDDRSNGSFGYRESVLPHFPNLGTYQDTWLQICQPVKQDTNAQKAGMSAKSEQKGDSRDWHWAYTSPSFFLKIRDGGSSKSPAVSEDAPEVFLFCLTTTKTPKDPASVLQDAYSDRHTYKRLLADPYGLLAGLVALWVSWADHERYVLAHEVDELEKKSENLVVDDLLMSEGQPNFLALHGISTKILQYLDVMEVVAKIQPLIRQRHSTLTSIIDTQGEAFRLVEAALQHHECEFTGIQSRLRGMNGRVKNQIQFAFNLVQQRDARVSQRDSNSMTTISVLTLFFLPATALASFFSMPFFYHDDSKGVRASADFYVFWALAVPVTALLLVFWLWRRAQLDGVTIISKFPQFMPHPKRTEGSSASKDPQNIV